MGTHTMNLALHQVLGDGVSQKGSLVDENKARFDFSHSQAMMPSECQRVEQIVREAVSEELPVHIETVPLDKALEINNLRAVFGERYPDPVRVVSIGPTVPELLDAPESPEWEKFSIELCGGTHIASTNVMRDFALIEESAVAKGVRRVVGITGDMAARAIEAGAELTSNMELLSAGAQPGDASAIDSARKGLAQLKLDIDVAVISAHVKASLREQLGAREKELVKLGKRLQQQQKDRAALAAVELAAEQAAAGERFVVLELERGLDGKSLQPLVQTVVKQTGIAAFALSTDAEAKKTSCCVAVPDKDTSILPANTWLQAVLKEVDGRGGGKPGAAQGSWSSVDGMPRALETARTLASEAFNLAVK